jgi:hypothetical protein
VTEREWLPIFDVPLSHARERFREWSLERGYTEEAISPDDIRIDVIRELGGDTARYWVSAELARTLDLTH